MFTKVPSQQRHGQWQKQRNIQTQVSKGNTQDTYEAHTNTTSSGKLKLLISIRYNNKLIITSNLSVIICRFKISKSIANEFAPVVHRGGGGLNF
jgi:hypothetical protein